MNIVGHDLQAPCNLCGARRFARCFIATRSSRLVVRCRQCGLLFCFPQPSASEAAALYSASYFADEYPDASAEDQVRLADARLRRIEEESGIGRLLDVGCGRGRFLQVARARGWEAVGLDVAPFSVQDAATVSGAIVLQGALSGSRPAGMAEFDVLTLWDVVEHLTDPAGDLRCALHWLHPGGLIVLQTQNANGVTASWMRQRWEQFVPFHLFHFSPRTLELALTQAGFVQIRVEPSYQFVAGLLLADGNAVPAAFHRTSNLKERLRRLRDTVYVGFGHDRFNIMVATARRPREA
jgi:SAM-dependent methyltransferase